MSDVNTIERLANEIESDLISIRRHLHKHPELSFNEQETSAYIKSILHKHNIRYTENWVKTGIVAEIGKGETSIAIRADMDALPIHEKNNCAYKSTVDGIMHACGHDVHTTCALGAAMVLKKIEGTLSHKILILFQPGEEVLPGGASLMIKEEALGNPLPKAIVGLHVFPEMEVGGLGFRKGEYMASSDEIHLKIIGKGGHAAMREQYNNPIVAASAIVVESNELFSIENIKKHTEKPSVFAIGKIEANGATNVIPEDVELKGTFRAMDEEWRMKAHEMFSKMVTSICEKYKVKYELNIIKGYPVLNNDEFVTEKCMVLAKEIIGEKNVHEIPVRLTAEDFAYYSQIMPSCFFRLGTQNTERGITSAVHTSTFDIDEKALVIGVKAMAWFGVNFK